MSQETKNYQYERNDFNTYGVRGSASGGTEVVANPEGEATADLAKLKVDDTIYELPEGTIVVGNPTLAGTEGALTGLQVGDTKYVVPDDVEIVDCTSGSLPSGVTYSSLATLMQTKVIVVKWTWSTKILEGILTEAPSGYLGLMASAFIETATNTGYYITLAINTNNTLNIISSNVTTFNTPKYNFDQPLAMASNLTRLTIGNQTYNLGALTTFAFTTAPTSANTDGGIRLVVLTAEPATKYSGYIYYITEA